MALLALKRQVSQNRRLRLRSLFVRGYSAIRVHSKKRNRELGILEGRAAMFAKLCTEKGTRKNGQWLPPSPRQSAMPHLVSDPRAFGRKKRSCLSTFALLAKFSTMRLLALPKNKNRATRKTLVPFPTLRGAC